MSPTTPIASPPSRNTGIAPGVTSNVSSPARPLTVRLSAVAVVAAVGVPDPESTSCTSPPLAPVFTVAPATLTVIVSLEAVALTTTKSSPPAGSTNTVLAATSA